MTHKIELNDKELDILRNALQIAFRAVWQQAEELNKLNLDESAKNVRAEANKIDGLCEMLSKIKKVQ